ncbi:MAG TPA: hypothetical protein VGO46_00580 [Gemmatimonadaceae bacterium]|nr:hypothetical protein [Gemmatimonadaceae bacterium]
MAARAIARFSLTTLTHSNRDMAKAPKESAASKITPEPRWPVILAVLASAALPFALPRSLSVLPQWIVASLVAVLIAAAVVTHYVNKPYLNQIFGFSLLGVLTIAQVFSLVRLIVALPHHTEVAERLLASAGVLWVTNVILFAIWYWRLDAGGPNARDTRLAHVRGAFLFPQMQIIAPGTDGKSIAEVESWHPQFVDYLALSFYTGTAFSPTDVPVLSRWAKLMMMVQAVMSLTTVALLAARAVNIL